MSATTVEDVNIEGARRRPNPGYRVAPPVTDAFTPWVSVLEDSLGTGEYRWELGPDGALVPMPIPEESTATVRPARRWRVRRSQ